MSYIYALVDPRTELIRYVGKADNPWERLWGHLRTKGVNPHKDFWILSLEREGLVPNVCILEEVGEDTWQEREKWWIAYCRARGLDLLNLMEGEDGGRQPEEVRQRTKFSEEARRRISRANRGRKISTEHKQSISRAQKGKKASEKTRRKLSEAHKGKRLSEETKRKISEAHKGKRPSIETLKKLSEARRLWWFNQKEVSML